MIDDSNGLFLMGDFDGTTHYLGDSWGSGTQCDATEITETRNK